MKDLKKLYQEIDKCIRCGTCRCNCPVFDVEQREWASARGKISLCSTLLKGEIEPSPKFIKVISECLVCDACKEGCPSGVDVSYIIHSARRKITQAKGLPLFHELLLKKILTPNTLTPIAIKAAFLLQGLFLKPEGMGCHRRFPLPLIERERLIPSLARRPFLNSYKGNGTGEGTIRVSASGPKVAFFVGCIINYTMPSIGEASLKLLKDAGASVIVPMSQGCCGMPALSSGDVETARLQAKWVLDIFEGLDVDFITTACASCGTALKRHLIELLEDEDDEIKNKAKILGKKVRDITELLVNELDCLGTIHDFHHPNPLRGEGRVGGTIHDKVVTYHDPCHLSRGQRIKDEPRSLIETSGVRFKEMSDPCRCCGLGGTFSLENYELSMEINREKTEEIKETGADIVVTACPGCIIHLKDGLHKAGIDREVRHVVELLI